jgi:hypothetical protein
MRAAHDDRAIGKWGVAVPIVKDKYDVLLLVGFVGPDIPRVYFYDDYILDANKELTFRPLVEHESPIVMYLAPQMSCAEGETFESALTQLRELLLEDGAHLPEELDADDLAERLRQTLTRAMTLKGPGHHRTDLKPVVTFVGDELAVTPSGIEHIYKKLDLPFWTVEELRGLRAPRDETDGGKEFAEHFAPEKVLERSGLADHPDLPAAMTVVALMQLNRVMR